MSNKRYIYENVEVIKIIDGDTIDAMVDLGFDTWKRVRFRLYGINAPELTGESKDLGIQSKEYLSSLIPEGTFIKVECLGQEKYGRWLAILIKDNINLNEKMIQEGYAEEYK